MYYPTQPSISYPEEQKLGFFCFFGFNLAKLWQKLRTAPRPLNLLLSGKAKILKFPQNFDLDFNLARALKKLFLRIAIKFVSNNSLPPTPCFPG